MTKPFKKTLLKFEECQYDTLYAITLNPDNEHQFMGDPTRIESFYKYHSKHLNTLINDSAKLELLLEVCQAGRLHFHGTIKLKDKIQFYINSLPKILKNYNIKIDVINDIKTWDIYCLKQNEIHQYCLKNQMPMPIHIGLDFKLMTKNFFTNHK